MMTFSLRAFVVIEMFFVFALRYNTLLYENSDNFLVSLLWLLNIIQYDK